MYRDRRQGCLQGLFELFLLDTVFNFLNARFGFGRGCSGIGCGLIFLCIFIVLACNIIFGTNWFSLTGR
jgi:hypothetical protein